MAYEGKITYKNCKECSTKFPVTRKDRGFCVQKCATRYAVRRLRASKKIKVKKFKPRKKRKLIKLKVRLRAK